MVQKIFHCEIMKFLDWKYLTNNIFAFRLHITVILQMFSASLKELVFIVRTIITLLIIYVSRWQSW